MTRPRTEYTFALCLSHDVDRIFKTYQYLWNALERRDPRELAGLLSSENPYWTFERTMQIEAGLGVRSVFNVLDEIHLSERPKREWLTLEGWKLFAGRYDLEDAKVASTLEVLADLGWEIGLHGSITSSSNPARFATEKRRVEAAAETEVIGNRQHYWNLSRPDTWRHLRDAGLRYDTSLGSSTEIEFQHGYDLRRPFDDEFVVFPWSVMDAALMESAESAGDVLDNCRELLETAREQRSVLVLNWHAGDVFSEGDYAGWGDMYERVIQEALDMGAWVGPPGEFYDALSHPDGTVADALDALGRQERSQSRLTPSARSDHARGVPGSDE